MRETASVSGLPLTLTWAWPRKSRVTPAMAEFNRDGKRFRVSAGAPKADSN